MKNREQLEEKAANQLKPFQEHQEACEGCKFFPLSMPCFLGAKLLNPALPDKTEKDYLHRMQESHKECE